MPWLGTYSPRQGLEPGGPDRLLHVLDLMSGLKCGRAATSSPLARRTDSRQRHTKDERLKPPTALSASTHPRSPGADPLAMLSSLPAAHSRMDTYDLGQRFHIRSCYEPSARTRPQMAAPSTFCDRAWPRRTNCAHLANRSHSSHL